MKPKADSAEDFLSWMSSVVLEKKVKKEVVDTDNASASSQPEKSVPPSQLPKIPFFSGDSKSDATYEVWRYEVECLYQESYSPDVIQQAIRRSLKGEASRVVMHLEPVAPITSIVQKLDNMYGTVAEKEDILSEFYSARQREDEKCARWSCRLEDILNKAIQKNLIDLSQFEKMLKTMFYKGLKPSLKDIIFMINADHLMN